MSAAPPLENPIIVDITTSYGAIIIGVVISSVIWGVSCTQAFIYYFNHSSDDRKVLKYWVATMVILDTANEILCVSGLWRVLVLQYGRIAGLSEVQPELSHHTWLTGLITVSIQFYFLYRVYVFSKRRRIWLHFAIVVGFISSWQLIEVVPYDILAFQNYTLPNLSQPRMVALGISLRACSAAADVFITAAMTYLLVIGNASALKRTRQMIYRLLMLTILGGLWPSVFSLLVLFLVALSPTTLWYCMFEFPLTSLYLSTLLANLNARSYVRGHGGIHSDMELGGISTHDISAYNGSSSQTLALDSLNRNGQFAIKLNNPKDTGLTIQVDTATEMRTDRNMNSRNPELRFKQQESV